VEGSHPKLCACHLPHIDGMVHLGTSHIPAGLRCGLYGSANCATTMVIYDICSTGWHLECLTPPLLEVPVGQWAAQSVLGVLGVSRKGLAVKTY
jgi:hypothetical protein